MNEKGKLTGFFRYFVRPLTLILVSLITAFGVFLSVFFLVQQNTKEQLTRAAIDESRQALADGVSRIDAEFRQEWIHFTSVNFTNYVRSLLAASSSGGIETSDYARLKTLQQEMITWRSISDVFGNVMLLFLTDDRDYICSPDFISDYLQRDYQSGLFSFDGMSYEQFRETVTACASHRYISSDMLVGRLTYSYSGGYDAVTGFLVCKWDGANNVQVFTLFPVNLEKLKNRLTSFRYVGSHCILSGRNGAIPPESETELTLLPDGTYSDEDAGAIYLLTPITSIGLTSGVSLDQTRIYSSMSNFSSLFSLLLWTFAILLFLLVALLFLRWSYPMIRLAQNIGKNDIDSDSSIRIPSQVIGSHIDSLEQKNATITQALKKLEPMARNELIARALHGGTLSNAEYDTIRGLIHNAEGAFRCVVIKSLTRASTETDAETALLTVFSRFFPTVDSTIYFDHALVLLIPVGVSSAQSADSSRDQLQTALREINEGFNNSYAAGVSDQHSGCSSLSAAYREAQSGWLYAMTWKSPAVVFGTNPQMCSSAYRFSYDQLQRINDALINGDSAAALKVFDQAVYENFNPSSDSRPAQAVCQQFFNDILGIIIRLSMRCDVMPVLDSLVISADKIPVYEQIGHLRKALIECAELIPYQNEEETLVRHIQQYLGEHYADPDLSLSKVAERFRLTESTLSKFFKSRVGVTFSAYLENLRIRKAEAMLLEGGVSVRRIASEIGYLNTATFYNAFRRQHNYTPSQWIKKERLRTLKDE